MQKNITLGVLLVIFVLSLVIVSQQTNTKQDMQTFGFVKGERLQSSSGARPDIGRSGLAPKAPERVITYIPKEPGAVGRSGVNAPVEPARVITYIPEQPSVIGGEFKPQPGKKITLVTFHSSALKPEAALTGFTLWAFIMFFFKLRSIKFGFAFSKRLHLTS